MKVDAEFCETNALSLKIEAHKMLSINENIADLIIMSKSFSSSSFIIKRFYTIVTPFCH